MFINSENAKRLAIYFFYDRRGIADRYVPYFLDDLKKNVSEIFIVCNGRLQEDSRKVLERYGTVMRRENKGFDVWAYKSALESFGWEKLQSYDEVIMMNIHHMVIFRIIYNLTGLRAEGVSYRAGSFRNTGIICR